MKSYKILALGDEYLLLQCNKGEYSTTIIDKGSDYKSIENGLIVGIRREDGRFNYYLADEETQTLNRIAENVTQLCTVADESCGLIFLFQEENRFCLLNPDNMEKRDLGSWFEKGFFLSGKEGQVTVRFFMDDAFTELDYVSAGIGEVFGENCTDYAGVFLRKDGLYDIFGAPDVDLAFEDNLNIVEVKKEYVRVSIDENDSDLCKIYFFDKEQEGYIQIFEGKNRINFDNAVLEFIEPAQEKSANGGDEIKTKAFLYLLEGTEKILLAQTDDVEGIKIDGFYVVIGDKRWDCVRDNVYFLKREPVDLKNADEAEDKEYSSDDGPADEESGEVSGEPDDMKSDEPEDKKFRWWNWLRR